MRGIVALFTRDLDRDPLAAHVRLLVMDRERQKYLAEDGRWVAFEEGARQLDAGIILPAGAVEAIGVALEEFLGHASHADTEARVLREWLAVEQRRVDEALKR